ncbi:MAG: FAD-dependent oxidoreductase, partial [Rudaea sp.]
MEHRYDHLIIGGGMTADAASKAIRESDAKASIGIVGDESHAPYERPPLSKALWKEKTVESIDLGTAKSGATLHLGRRIVALDRTAHTARDDRGDTYRYRKLLLAIGATPRKLSFDGERVIHFRTLDDYLALRRFATPGAHIGVVGGGFIGSELAASLATN